ncbi:recombinase family protein [Microvirga sp. ACRRW]|uniref:recombinase family protein n=1 Tax=Microvirga sp. ACRRW TaxID=2918205 RepID=UPI001EF5141F|nr:recombinase family protein [Microvirga sp. ACRRW]MCG7392647.1 recombinase family protein [Microvirga sp. ACRRW]
MKIGYARVSTDEQDPELQVRALKAEGCDPVFVDIGVSGTRKIRPELTNALNTLNEGDVLVVWKIDRLGRSLSHLIGLLNELGQRGVQFKSLQDPIDTTTPSGMMHFQLLAVFAEFERNLISERTKAGLQVARSRGRRPGRPRSLTADQCFDALLFMHQGRSLQDVARQYGVAPRTLARALDWST